MDVPNPIVLGRASARNHAETPRSGVVHVNLRHTRSFTVVGNHLAQHAEMSLVAIGLALHIQSLPTGARIGIKDLSARFPESEHRIAGALRELEVHGYLKRSRERLPGGQVVTRTVSYNRPGYLGPVSEDPEVPEVPELVPPPAPAAPAPQPRPAQPRNPWRHDAAIGILAGLRRVDSRMALGRQDIEQLAPAVEAWLERGVGPTALTVALTSNLPTPPRNPAGLVAYRLTVQLPPELTPVAPQTPYVPPDPFQTCQDEECGLAFRAPEPGLCGECRTETTEAA